MQSVATSVNRNMPYFGVGKKHHTDRTPISCPSGTICKSECQHILRDAIFDHGGRAAV